MDFDRLRRLAAALLLPFLAGPALAQMAAMDAEEREVAAAAIRNTRLEGTESWLLVFGETASFRCESGHEVALRFEGGCSGMRTREESVGEVILRIQKAFPELSDEVLLDFRVRGDTVARVGETLPLPLKQVLWTREDAQSGTSWQARHGTPTLAVSISRVALNRDRNQALVYVGAAGLQAGRRSYGEFVFLNKRNGRWFVDGTTHAWALQAEGNAPPASVR